MTDCKTMNLNFLQDKWWMYLSISIDLSLNLCFSIGPPVYLFKSLSLLCVNLLISLSITCTVYLYLFLHIFLYVSVYFSLSLWREREGERRVRGGNIAISIYISVYVKLYIW